MAANDAQLKATIRFGKLLSSLNLPVPDFHKFDGTQTLVELVAVIEQLTHTWLIEGRHKEADELKIALRRVLQGL